MVNLPGPFGMLQQARVIERHFFSHFFIYFSTLLRHTSPPLHPQNKKGAGADRGAVSLHADSIVEAFIPK